MKIKIGLKVNLQWDVHYIRIISKIQDILLKLHVRQNFCK